MKYVNLIDYIKSSKDNCGREGCFARFKIDKLKDNKLILTRNKIFHENDSGLISSSLILDKNGRPITTSEDGSYIVSLKDIEDVLNGCFIGLDVAESDIDPLEVWLRGYSKYDLGGSLLEYSQEKELRKTASHKDVIMMSYLRTADSHRKMGMARRLVDEVSRFGSLSGYDKMCGIGSPLEDGFCVSNKTLEEMGFYVEYEECCRKSKKACDVLSGVVDLAIFYSRLGFNIYPMGNTFYIERRIDKEHTTKTDELFLKRKQSVLDEETIMFGR